MDIDTCMHLHSGRLLTVAGTFDWLPNWSFLLCLCNTCGYLATVKKLQFLKLSSTPLLLSPPCYVLFWCFFFYCSLVFCSSTSAVHSHRLSYHSHPRPMPPLSILLYKFLFVSFIVLSLYL